ncbi:Detected protein of unknown function [Hibiscus syriacus]|uniref:Uncharacterized protein n=1 Tax=Hibiscus syriacus TaxID=106335 RepID=A0A6A2Z5G2_HIBSY|nr:Detected protein of unknown function [Hibiscus syriacus]
MGEEVRMIDFEASAGDDEEATTNAVTTFLDKDDDVDERVLEWEMGLPNCNDLTPLTRPLIPQELASAFSISPEPRRTDVDVNRASQNTLFSLRSTGSHSSTTNNTNSNSPCFNDTIIVEPEGYGSGSGSGSDPKKMRNVVIAEEADSAVRTTENSDDPSGRTLKRPRLVWTPQLHKRFVDVVAHLGIKYARMQGLSNEGPSASDQLFASTPVPQSLHESGSGGGSGGGGSDGVGGGSVNVNGHLGMAIPMPYGTPMMPVPMPMYGHMGMHQGLYHHQPQQHHQNGYEANSYGMMQQRDWSGGNKYGSVLPYPHHMAPDDKLN